MCNHVGIEGDDLAGVHYSMTRFLEPGQRSRSRGQQTTLDEISTVCDVGLV
jgi:hypothetical protein